MNTEIFEKIPAESYEAAQQIGKELVAGGSATVVELVGLVGDEFGDPNGVKPKYALHALVIYASRGGAENERKMVAQALAGQLAAGHSDELKAFILRQLQLCGRPEEVPALAALLGDDRLCEPATQALLAIGGQRALSALRAAMPNAEGKRQVTIGQAVKILSGK